MMVSLEEIIKTMTQTHVADVFRRKTLGLTFVLSAAAMAFAQEKVSIAGNVKSTDGAVIPYTSIVFENKANKALNDAVLTDDKGVFKLSLVPGSYTVKIDAVGFKAKTMTQNIGKGNLPTITLEPEGNGAKTKEIDAVVITAAPKAYKVELDKKVYDPSTDLISKGGSLQDVLSNVPSVDVDTDGTVSMRGSSNVRFLINGKPSALLGIDDGANALRAIPADQIERIEVITNPSSKFEASGTAGILNIILKKNKKLGFNGSVTGAVGYLPQTMLNTNLSWRKGNLTWFINGGGSYRKNRGIFNSYSNYKNVMTDGNITHSEQLGTNYNEQNSYHGATGMVYDFNDKTSMNASITLRAFDSHTTGSIDITEERRNIAPLYSHRDENGDGKNNTVQGDFGIDHKFNQQGHNLSLAVSLQQTKNENDSFMREFNNSILGQNDEMNQNSTRKTALGKLDYELPIGENSKLEAGYRLDINHNIYDNVLNTDSVMNSVQAVADLYSNTTDYKEMFNAAYVQFKSKLGNLGYQLGLRNEHSNIDIDYSNKAGDVLVKNKNYNNLFPSVYLSYDISKNNQILLNYSRRIDRPRSFFLVPYGRYSSPRTLFAGNIDLDPSFVDSYELGYNYSKGKLTINPTLYYRRSNNEVRMVTYRADERVNTLYSMPINNGVEARYGLDFNFSAELLPWWKWMGSFNIFGYDNSGYYTFNVIDANGNTAQRFRDFSGNGLSTIARLTSSFRIDRTFNIQLQGFYRGAERTVSTKRNSMYALNFGASKTIWKGNGTIAFNIQDIFSTRRMNNFTFSDVMDSETYMQWMPRQMSLTFTYRFRQGEKVELPRKKQDRNGGYDEGADMPPM